jgi:glycosyltransferase involved in cell wall biosynthesis
VSVIIPVYNGERFLEDAIGSVLEQTYPSVECLVVDDGSTDGSYEIASAREPEIRLIRQANRGVAAARNAGAAAAAGSFIAFLDADDVWLPTKLERQMPLFADDPSLGLAYCGLKVTDRHLEGGTPRPCPRPEEALRKALLLEAPAMGVAQTSVIPVEVFRSRGGFDERLSTAADTDLGCRIAATYPIACVDEPLVLYRQHDGQMHSDLIATERDMQSVFDRFFSSNEYPGVRALKASANASLHFTLGLAYLKERQPVRGAQHLGKAFLFSPARWLLLMARWIRASRGGPRTW